MRAPLKIAVIIIAAAGLNALPAQAQQWSAELQAGRMRSALDAAASSTQTLAVGLSYQAVRSGFNLSLGVPTAEGEPLWGALGGSHRALLYSSSFVLGVDLAGSGYLMRDRADRVRRVTDALGRPQVITEPAITGTAFAAQGLPVIGYEGVRFQVHARAGASYYTSRFGEAERTRTVGLTDLQLTFMPTSSFAVMPVVRRYFAEEADYTYTGASAIVGHGQVSVWGSAGIWPGLADVGGAWAAGATLQLHERASLTASGRHDAFDALYGNPAQTSWSLGLAIRLGSGSVNRLPTPAAYKQGRATIRLAAKHSLSAPMIAGDFTNWQPRPMQRSGDAWTYAAELKPGVYNFAFVDARGKWFVPVDYPGRKDDGFGGEVAVLVVRP